MIDWTGTYIITYNIIFGMKKGYTWVASLKTSQRGGCNPLNPPPGSASASEHDPFSDGIVFKNEPLPERSEAILTLLDGLQELHFDW